MSKFEVYKDKKGETRFRYRAKNNEIMFSSEGYAAKASAMSAIKSIMKNAPTATIDDNSPGFSRNAASSTAGWPPCLRIGGTLPKFEREAGSIE